MARTVPADVSKGLQLLYLYTKFRSRIPSEIDLDELSSDLLELPSTEQQEIAKTLGLRQTARSRTSLVEKLAGYYASRRKTRKRSAEPSPQLALAWDMPAPTRGDQQSPPEPSRQILDASRKRRPEKRESPLIYSKLAEPTPSVVFPTLWTFAHERQLVYLRRAANSSPPWTQDPILRAFKFTNPYRAADRVSQYFLKMSYAEDSLDPDTIFLRTLLFKIFNKIETWEHIASWFGGLPYASGFRFDDCERFLTRLHNSRTSIYSAAYIMPSGGVAGLPKHQMHLHLVERMLREHIPDRLANSRSLKETYDTLLAYPSLGPFLAFQYTIDLNYTTLLNFSEMDYVVAGPGALDGLSKCFSSLGGYSPADTIRWVTERQDCEFLHAGLDFPGLWGRSLQLIDVQNLFCEISKYTRVSHPDVPGKSGRTRIKQRFSPTGYMPEPFFPPKWGLGDKISQWLQSNPLLKPVPVPVSHPQPSLFAFDPS